MLCSSPQPFINRAEAGRLLASRLSHYADQPDLLVLALPRGGVPVGFEVARALQAPLDVFVVRKLLTPRNPELALGAIATGGIRILNEALVQSDGISKETLDAITAQETVELQRRKLAYRGSYSEPDVHLRTVILVDDGVATGATLQAAIRSIQLQHPRRLIVAVPTIPLSVLRKIRPQVDECVSILSPELFSSVGQWYRDFRQTSDAEVTDFLHRIRYILPNPKNASASHPKTAHADR